MRAARIPTFAGFPALAALLVRRTLRSGPLCLAIAAVGVVLGLTSTEGVQGSPEAVVAQIAFGAVLALGCLVTATSPSGAAPLRHLFLAGLCARRLALHVGAYAALCVLAGYGIASAIALHGPGARSGTAAPGLAQALWYLLLPLCVGGFVGTGVAVVAAPCRSLRGGALKVLLVLAGMFLHVPLLRMRVGAPWHMALAVVVSSSLLAAASRLERVVRNA